MNEELRMKNEELRMREEFEFGILNSEGRGDAGEMENYEL